MTGLCVCLLVMISVVTTLFVTMAYIFPAVIGREVEAQAVRRHEGSCVPGSSPDTGMHAPVTDPKIIWVPCASFAGDT